MPQSALLTCRNNVGMSVIESALEPAFRVHRYPTSRGGVEIQLRDDQYDWYVSIEEMSSPAEVAEDYETNESLSPQFRGSVRGSVFYSIRYNNFQIVKEAVELILATLEDELDHVWMDTDYGEVLPGREVLRRLREEPGWDWRHAYSPKDKADRPAVE